MRVGCIRLTLLSQSAAAVATSPEGHRSRRSGRANRHRRWAGNAHAATRDSIVETEPFGRLLSVSLSATCILLGPANKGTPMRWFEKDNFAEAQHASVFHWQALKRELVRQIL
jgi:hypothetical protein